MEQYAILSVPGGKWLTDVFIGRESRTEWSSDITKALRFDTKVGADMLCGRIGGCMSAMIFDTTGGEVIAYV